MTHDLQILIAAPDQRVVMDDDGPVVENLTDRGRWREPTSSDHDFWFGVLMGCSYGVFTVARCLSRVVPPTRGERRVFEVGDWRVGLRAWDAPSGTYWDDRYGGAYVRARGRCDVFGETWDPAAEDDIHRAALALWLHVNGIAAPDAG